MRPFLLLAHLLGRYLVAVLVLSGPLYYKMHALGQNPAWTFEGIDYLAQLLGLPLMVTILTFIPFWPKDPREPREGYSDFY